MAVSWWRKRAWDLGWWTPFLPDSARRWLYLRIATKEERNKIRASRATS
jgi:hypothetical protein